MEEKVQYADDLIQTLTLKEIECNQELQDARKESISGLSDILSNTTTLTIKRMGEIDRKAFQETCLLKFFNDDWERICAKLCSEWEQYVRDPHWHPFKVVEGQKKEVINDDDDEKLKALRNEYGENIYNAVSKALLELNESMRVEGIRLQKSGTQVRGGEQA